MKIQLTNNGIRLFPEGQSEYFQLEILWNHRGNLSIEKDIDFDSRDLKSLELFMEKDDKDNKQEIQSGG